MNAMTNDVPKTPRFSDLHRFPVPYVRADKTNVAETFARVRRELKTKLEKEQDV